jgi:cytochrome c556
MDKANYSLRSLGPPQDMEGATSDTQNEGTVTLDKVWEKLTEIEAQQTAKNDNLLNLIDKKFDELKRQITEDIGRRIESFKRAFRSEINKDLEQLRQQCATIQTQLEAINIPETSPFDDVNKCIVISNFPHDYNANLKVNVSSMLDEINSENELDGVDIVDCMRLGDPAKQTRERPGLLKVALDSLESKKKVLCQKGKLKNTVNYKDVGVRSSMTHTERLMQMNFRTLLRCVPDGKDYRLSGNGRIISRQRVPETDDAEDGADDDNQGFEMVHRGRQNRHGRGGNRGRGHRGRGGGRGRGGAH